MTVLFTLIGLAILLIIIVSLCAAGTIGVNRGIGIRIPATRLSARTWRAGHQAALLPAIMGGTVLIIVSGLGIAFPDLTVAAQVVGVFLLLATLTWAAVRASVAARATVDS